MRCRTSCCAAILVGLIVTPWTYSNGLAAPGGHAATGIDAPEAVARQQVERSPRQFTGRVSLVRVDVIVTGADGSFIADLEAGDFAVSEDGTRQRIVDVQLVDLGAGQVRSLMAGEAPVAEGNIERGARAEIDRRYSAEDPAESSAEDPAEDVASDPWPGTDAIALGALIFLVDGPSLNLAAKANFADAWARLLEDTEALRVPRAAYLVDNRGRLEELAPLGYDVETLRSAARQVRADPVFGTSVRSRLFELANDLTNDFSYAGAERQVARAKARAFEREETRRSLATYELLTDFADALSSRSGRTALVWVSTGVKTMSGGPYDSVLGGGAPLFSPDPRIKAAQDALHRAANASNVSVCAIDPSLLASTRSLGTDVEVGVPQAARLLSTPAVERSLDSLRDSMRMAAAATGGRAFIQATDIGLVLEEIESDTSRFYLIAYERPRAQGDGEYHEIEVEVLREGVDVRARPGYVDRPADERLQRAIEAALALPGVATDLDVSVEVLRPPSPEDGPNVLSEATVHARDLALAVGPDGERYVSIDLHAVILDESGTVATAHEQLSARPGGDGGRAAGPEDAAPQEVSDMLTWHREWTLEPGTYVLNVAVLDNVSGKLGAASVELELGQQ